MRQLKKTNSAFALLGLTLSICVPSWAHDPLRNHDHSSHGETHAHIAHPPEKLDLDAIRARVGAFRRSGDDRELDAAWALVEPALREKPVEPATLIMAAHVAQARHEFSLALELSGQALDQNPHVDEAWLLLASIHLVQGQPDPAAHACRQLRYAPLLVALTCQARVALINGEHALAVRRLAAMLTAPEWVGLPPELLAWSYSVAGDLSVAAGDVGRARNYYEKSLDLVERTQVRAALADVLLSAEQHEDAWVVLSKGSSALPLLVRRFIAAQKLGRLQEMEAELEKVRAEFAAWIAAEDWLHAREMTRFFLDVEQRPALARRLAVQNLSVQREPEDLRLEERTRQYHRDLMLALPSDTGPERVTPE